MFVRLQRRQASYIENLRDILQPPMSEIEFNIKHRAVHRNLAVFIDTFHIHLHYELA